MGGKVGNGEIVLGEPILGKGPPNEMTGAASRYQRGIGHSPGSAGSHKMDGMTRIGNN
jgi:hypothetical protein